MSATQATGTESLWRIIFAALEDAAEPSEPSATDIDDGDTVFGEISAQKFRQNGQENGFSVAFNDDDTVGEEQVSLGYIKEPLQESIVTCFKHGASLARGKRHGCLREESIFGSGIFDARLGLCVERMTWTGRVCVLDLASGGLRQELHESELALGVQMRLRLLDQQQWQSFRLPTEKQKLTGHVEQVV